MKFGTIITSYTPSGCKIRKYLLQYIGVFIFIVITMACNTGTQKNHIGPTEEQLPADFVNFYEKFHNDSIYQLQHIVFPLQGVPVIGSQTVEEIKAFTWPSNTWKMHHHFENADSIYNVSYQVIDPTLITEMIEVKGSSYKMLRRFSKSQNKEWYLIYYAAMNQYE